MVNLKKWVALLATITMLLLALMSGLISAAPAEKQRPSQEQPAVEDKEWTEPAPKEIDDAKGKAPAPEEAPSAPEEPTSSEDQTKSRGTPEPGEVTDPIRNDIVAESATGANQSRELELVEVTQAPTQSGNGIMPVTYADWSPGGGAAAECAAAGCNAKYAYKVEPPGDGDFYD